LAIAELPRAKRANEAPWVRKIGNPSSQKNLVMTSAYERPSVRTDDEGGEGSLTVNLTEKQTNPSFLQGVFKEKENSFQFVVSKGWRRLIQRF